MLSTCLFGCDYYYCYRLKLTGIGPNAHGFRTLSDGTNVEYFNEPPDGGNYPATSSNFAFFSDDVLLLGLNQVGGGIIGDEETRVYGNFLWVEQNMSKYYVNGVRAMVVFDMQQ